MKYIASDYEDHNLYYALADQSEHAMHRISEARMTADLCLFSMFSGHVVIAGSHLFESSVPRRVLTKHAEFLSSGTVIVDLPEHCRDFVDFVEHKCTSRPKEVHWRRRDRASLAKDLDQLCPYTLSWTPSYESGFVRDSLCSAMNDADSDLRRMLKAVPSTKIAECLRAIGDMEDTHRQALFDIADKWLGRGAKSFKEEVNTTYYVSGALHKQLRPVLPDGPLARIVRATDDLPNISQGAITRRLLVESLSDMQLDVEGFLVPAHIVQLRLECASQLAAFQRRWWEVMERADDNSDHQDTRRLFHGELASEARRARGLKKTQAIAKRISLCTLALGGLNTYLQLGLGRYSWPVSAAATVMSRVADARLRRLPFTVMGSLIRDRLQAGKE